MTQTSPETETLIEKEAKRRCIEQGTTLEYLACQDRRFRHDDRRPWWRAMYCGQIEGEIERLQKAGFSVVPAGHAQTPAAASETQVRSVIVKLVTDDLDWTPLDLARSILDNFDVSPKLCAADTSTLRTALPTERSCQCDSPVIRCDNRGCRCTVCGELERLPIPTHREGEHQS
jgi:hypothetical protein